MPTSLEDIKQQLKQDTKFQQTPTYYTEQDYRLLVLDGVKRLYVDIGREDNFSDEYSETYVDEETTYGYVSRDLSLTEKEYILLASKIAFKRQIKDDVNNLVSYTTDALSIAGADKPYKNLENDIHDLENRLSILLYKFLHK